MYVHVHLDKRDSIRAMFHKYDFSFSSVSISLLAVGEIDRKREACASGYATSKRQSLQSYADSVLIAKVP